VSAAFIIYRHRDNIARIRSGTEHLFIAGHPQDAARADALENAAFVKKASFVKSAS